MYHEKLDVYRVTLELVARVGEILKSKDIKQHTLQFRLN